jgi:hypothetical protein
MHIVDRPAAAVDPDPRISTNEAQAEHRGGWTGRRRVKSFTVQACLTWTTLNATDPGRAALVGLSVFVCDAMVRNVGLGAALPVLGLDARSGRAAWRAEAPVLTARRAESNGARISPCGEQPFRPAGPLKVVGSTGMVEGEH